MLTHFRVVFTVAQSHVAIINSMAKPQDQSSRTLEPVTLTPEIDLKGRKVSGFARSAINFQVRAAALR
jgi:hypothetical protein